MAARRAKAAGRKAAQRKAGGRNAVGRKDGGRKAAVRNAVGSKAVGRKVVRREVVLDHRYLRLSLDTERDAAGREHTFLLGTGPEIVVVVPVWPDGTVTLLSQRRYGLRARSIEAPGGHVDPGETPAAAARRELREETGISARHVVKLMDFLPAIKLQQTFHVFVATGLRAGRARPESDEDVRNLRLPLLEAADRALTGWVRHGPTIVALHAAVRALTAPADAADDDR